MKWNKFTQLDNDWTVIKEYDSKDEESKNNTFEIVQDTLNNVSSIYEVVSTNVDGLNIGDKVVVGNSFALKLDCLGDNYRAVETKNIVTKVEDAVN